MQGGESSKRNYGGNKELLGGRKMLVRRELIMNYESSMGGGRNNGRVRAGGVYRRLGLRLCRYCRGCFRVASL